jgi:hypothetical protein
MILFVSLKTLWVKCSMPPPYGQKMGQIPTAIHPLTQQRITGESQLQNCQEVSWLHQLISAVRKSLANALLWKAQDNVRGDP